MKVVVLLWCLAGCDALFRLSHGDYDAPDDAVARACWRIEHRPAAGKVGVFTSPNGVDWARRHTVDVLVPLANLEPRDSRFS